MSIESLDYKNYLRKLDLDELEGVLSNEELQNCLMTVSAMDDEDSISKVDIVSAGKQDRSKLDLQSVSSVDVVDVKKPKISNLKIQNLLKE